VYSWLLLHPSPQRREAGGRFYLCFIDAGGGADFDAVAAILALGGIDLIIFANHGDRAIRAFAFASAALDAFVFYDYVGHWGIILSCEYYSGGTPQVVYDLVDRIA
jgi:hypothetical protein